MKIENGKKKRNIRNSFVPTSVRGVRAEDTFWEMCENTAKKEGITRNALIVKVVGCYCENKGE